MKLAIFVLVICATYCQAGLVQKFRQEDDDTKESWPPSFCNGYACPKYTQIEKTDDYEVRRYDACHWVSTDKAPEDLQSEKKNMFWRLFNYISGSNSDDSKIAMTVPVTTSADTDQTEDSSEKKTMSFYLPMDKPPSPTEEGVYLKNSPSMTVYVSSFGGYADETKYREKLDELLKKIPASESAQTFFMVGYDAPYKFWSRHNEVWVVKST